MNSAMKVDTMKQKEQPTIYLCDDLLFQVLSFLDHQSMYHALTVSKRWNNIIDNGVTPVWKVLLLSNVNPVNNGEDEHDRLWTKQVDWKKEYRRYLGVVKGQSFWKNRKYAESKINNKSIMVSHSPPQNHPFVKCVLSLTKKKMRKTIYKLHHEESESLLLVAKLVDANLVNKKYCIYYNEHDKQPIGKLVSRKFGLHFKYIDLTNQQIEIDIDYQSNVIRRSYNKLHTRIPNADPDGKFVISSDRTTKQYHNRDPIWDPQYNSWTLNFGGRVKMKSARNFQLMEDNETTVHNYLVFGRLDPNTFILDYRYPFNTVQAFCLALSALDRKLACM
jgi:hypothetical protein